MSAGNWLKDAAAAGPGWLAAGLAGLGVITRRSPLRMVGIGDSNTLGYAQTPWSSSYESAISLSGGKLVGVKNAGIAGQTSAQIAERIYRDAIAYYPDAVVAQIGTNDARSAAIVLPYLTNMANAVLGSSSSVFVMCSTYPAANDGAQALAVQIKALAASFNNPRIIYAATNEALVDPATGFLRASYAATASGSEVHINDLGGQAAGQAILTALSSVLSQVDPQYPAILTSASALGPLLNGTFPSSSAGVTSGGTVTWAASDTGIVGGYARVAITSTAFITLSPSSSFDITQWRGKRVRISGKMRISSTASSYSGQILPSWSGMSGVDFVGLAQTFNTFNGNLGNWRFFNIDFDVPTDAVYSSSNWNFIAVASVVGGTVTVDLAELNTEITGPMRTSSAPMVAASGLAANTTLTTQSFASVDASAAARTITLPPVATVTKPITIMKRDSSANAVTVQPPSGTINGAASVNTTTQYAGFTFYPDGSNWLAR